MKRIGEIVPTPQQESLLRAAVADLLVSAAAGSGKTQVMTDRIVKRISEGSLDIRQVLVMTFTDAAAANMRRKIVEKLRKAAETAPRDAARRLRRQAGLLPHASISTIHGFCLEVLRSASYQAVDGNGRPLLEPGFRVVDAAESEILRLEALDGVFEARYLAAEAALEKEDPQPDAFLDLVDAYGDHRGDADVRTLALSVHDFLRSMPAYREWSAEWLERLRRDVADFGASEGARLLLVQLRDLLDRAGTVLPGLLESLDLGWSFVADREKDALQRASYRASLRALVEIRERLASDGLAQDRTSPDLWDAVFEASRRITAERLPSKAKNAPVERLAFVEDFRTYVAEPVHCLTGRFRSQSKRFVAGTRYLFHATAAEIGRGMAPAVPLCESLMALVLDLDEAYSVLKRQASAIDFSDIEHLALAALEREGPEGAFRTRYQEIYVDEYQDTSGIQEAIVQRLARGNRFLVGDVKQSIYRFRHARPEIFQEKADRYVRDVPEGFEREVLPNGVLRGLTRNFRSVPAVLAAANLVFARIMSREAGEVEYDASQALVPDRSDPPDGRVPVELVLVDAWTPDGAPVVAAVPDAEETEGEPDEVDDAPMEAADAPDGLTAAETDKQRLEALWIAGRIRGLAAEAVAEGRDKRYEGIAVLSRTRSVASVVGETLKAQGIPVEEEPAGEFLATPELRTMEALVHVLDNPRQDIPLAAVMQSLLYPEPFGEEDLLLIRLHLRTLGGRAAFFHESLDAYAEGGPDPDLRGRAARFRDSVRDLRERAVHSGLDALIGHVYLSTGYLERASLLPGGTDRVSDLRMFHEWASAFESTRMRGLYGFARYIERMREKGSGDAVRGARPGGADAVRIATFHGSKGLEFPVVFLAGLGHAFYLKEKQDRAIVSETLGFGPDIVDLVARAAYPSHLKLAVWEHSRRAMLAEEMRLLYVAMTRAMDRLYLLASTKSGPNGPDRRLARLVEESSEAVGSPVPPYRVLSAKSHFEWLLMAFASEFPEQAADLVGTEALVRKGAKESTASGPPFWVARRADLAGIRAALPATPSEPLPASLPEGPPTETAPVASGPYRFDGSAHAPAKISVSELKRRNAPEPEDESDEGGEGEGAVPPDRLAERADEDGRRLRVRFGALKSVDLEMKDLPKPGRTSPADAPSTVRRLPPNEVGTAVHSVFRYLDLPAASENAGPGEVLRQIERMLEHRMLTSDEAAAARDFAAPVATFASSGLARRILAAGPQVYREIPFTLSVPCDSLYAGIPDAGAFAPDDRVMVQGIIDLWFVENGYGVLVDYKTDRIDGGDDVVAETLRRRYASQLDYYAQAVLASTGVAVAERVLWLVRTGKAYRI